LPIGRNNRSKAFDDAPTAEAPILLFSHPSCLPTQFVAIITLA